MSAVELNLEQLTNDLSLRVVMLDPDDLVSLGELLENAEQLLKNHKEIGPPEGVIILQAIVKSLEAMILEQVKDKTRLIELIGRGAGLLQEINRTYSANMPVSVNLGEFFSEVEEQTGHKTELEKRLDIETTKESPDSMSEIPIGDGIDIKEPVTPIDQDSDLFFSFINESLEHIEAIEVSIINLEQDPSSRESLDSVFRPFHTIKGVSGFLNLHHINQLTHQIENLLDDARNERLAVTPGMIDVILDAVDMLKKMITDARAFFETGEAMHVEYGLDHFTERIQSVQQGQDEREPPSSISNYSGWMLGEILIDQQLISADELEKIIENQEESRLRLLGDMLVEKGLISSGDLEDALHIQLEQQGKKLGEILIETGRAKPADITRAVEEQTQNRDKKLGEILIREKKAEVRDVAEALREQKKTPSDAAAAGYTVKVDTNKLDNLVDMVGELVIAQSLVSSNKNILKHRDQKLIRDLSHMARITSDLQKTAMSMRMVQIRQTFQKMIRLVRDLSRKSGKNVDLTMNGEETEIDRNMVEAIYDPLVHMVRNSVDHGIESPGEREQKGKSTSGRIVLRAYHQGGNVIIEIEDDGKGLDRDRIFQKAIDRKLVSPDDILSDSAVFNLIFHPGFSTAEKITDVSGRGVGMDVVKRSIEKLRGKIELSSRKGFGTKISIRLPLTLAIIDGMIVRVGDNRYILPTVTIHESFRPGENDYHTIKGRGELIKVRENLLPLIRLDRVLGVQAASNDPTEALVVVVENEGERKCIMVDEVLGKQEVVIKSLGERLKYVRALAGGSILGDGRVGLILDVAGVFEAGKNSSGGTAPISSRPDEPTGERFENNWEMGPT